MRVTNALTTRATIARLQTNQRLLAEAQERVTSGKRITRTSDDPAGATSVMQMSSSLRAVDQYRRNAEATSSRLTAEESALDQLTSLLTRSRELAAGQSGATANADTRRAAAAEVKQLLEQAVQLGNTRLGDDFLFGGANSAAVAPFDAAQGALVPRYVRLGALATPEEPRGRRMVEVGAGNLMQDVHDGGQLLVDSGVLASLHDLHAALAANDEPGIATAMSGVDGAFADVQALIGDVGARQNQVDALLAGFETLTANLEESRAELSEVEMEQAITEMMSRQTAYQAAMLASSKVMGMSLTDYLR